jgi:hypothetical protein
MNQPRKRNRSRYLVGVITVVALGLPSRLIDDLPDFYVQYLGDGLWALMIFLLFGLLSPIARTRNLALLALAVTWGIEFSQFIQADWMNAIRGVKLGGLVLGYVFRWTDLVAYTGGVGTGVLLENAILMKARSA